MQKISDRITLGVVAGLLASIPGRLINALEFRSGLSPARAIGASANGILTCVTGVLTTYVLSATGRDKAMLKGMGIGSLLWLTIYGLGSKSKLIKKSKKPTTPLLSLADHLIFGALTGIIVVTLGEPSLFPNEKKPVDIQAPEAARPNLNPQTITKAEPTINTPINQSARKITKLKDRVRKIEKISFKKPRPLIPK